MNGPAQEPCDEQTMGAKMNIIRSSYLCLLLGAVLVAQAQAGTSLTSEPGRVAQNTLSPNSAPADNTLRRINPNSRQGTIPATPAVRSPSTAPVVRQPSIENGQIGNGYPRSQPPPRTIKPTAPSLQPRDNR